MFRRFFMLVAAFMLIQGDTATEAAPPQTSEVYAPFNCDFGAIPCTDVGNAKLTRKKNSVAMNIQTSGLEGGAAYTAWWVIFNNPSACTDGCDPGDFGNPDVKATVIWATGHVVGGNGLTGFAASLNEGDISNVAPFNLPGDAFGLIDAATAEILIAVRYHGPTIPGQMPAQIKQFFGGCPPNICEDKEFAHFPVP